MLTDRVLLDSFITLIAARLGLRLEHQPAAEAIQRRAIARGLPVDRYMGRCDDPAELRELASELTVGETYFFRHTEQLDAFTEHALPVRLAARADARQLRVLSAGCSTGEEPYTLAMLLRDRVPLGWQVEVHGVDVDMCALRRAASGEYSRWSLRATPPAVEHRWFQPRRNHSVLSPEIRDRVQLAEVNLAADPSPWQQPWDVVFCRNVLMYFTQDQADALITRIVDGLAPGGFLFLGHAEVMWARAAARLETCNSHGTFYYRRRDDAPQLASASGLLSLAPGRAGRATGPVPVMPAAVRPDGEVAARAATGDEHELQRALMQLAQIGGPG